MVLPGAGGSALDPRMVAVWRVGAGAAALGATVWAGLAVAVLHASGSDPPGPAWGPVVLVAVAGGVAAWRWPRARYAHWRYAVAEDALELRHGVLFRTTSLIPYFRVQHIDVNQGPVERALGLSRLVVRTASSTTDAELPGIPADRAETLRRLILERTGHGDAV